MWSESRSWVDVCGSCGQSLSCVAAPMAFSVQPVSPRPNLPGQTNPQPIQGTNPTALTEAYRRYYRTAQNRGDTRVLLITLGMIFGLFLSGLLLGSEGHEFEALVTGSGLLLVMLAVWLFVVRLYQRSFLGNALRVEKGHFGNLKTISAQVATLLSTRGPEIYIFQDPYLNDFSLGFKQPYTIALHSAIVENLDQEELMAVLVHETGHIWFGHTRISTYVTPVVFQVPIVSAIMEYIFGFWRRRAELTCDRLALLVTKKPRAVIESLIKTYIGPHFLTQLDAEGVLFQEHQTRGWLNKLAQSMSSHPFMTTRVKKLLEYSRELGLVYVDKNGMLVCENCGLKSSPNVTARARCSAQLRQPSAAVGPGTANNSASTSACGTAG